MLYFNVVVIALCAVQCFFNCVLCNGNKMPLPPYDIVFGNSDYDRYDNNPQLAYRVQIPVMSSPMSSIPVDSFGFKVAKTVSLGNNRIGTYYPNEHILRLQDHIRMQQQQQQNQIPPMAPPPSAINPMSSYLSTKSEGLMLPGTGLYKGKPLRSRTEGNRLYYRTMREMQKCGPSYFERMAPEIIYPQPPLQSPPDSIYW